MKNNNNEEDIFISTEKWLGIDMKKIQKEELKKQKKEQKAAKAKKRKEWFARNLVTILFVAPIAAGTISILAGAAANVLRAANRRSVIDKEQKMKDLYCYDRSLGHYWQLRRKLTNSDWVKINQRRSDGEALGDILADMNVLK